jgi:hypothetical protein
MQPLSLTGFFLYFQTYWHIYPSSPGSSNVPVLVQPWSEITSSLYTPASFENYLQQLSSCFSNLLFHCFLPTWSKYYHPYQGYLTIIFLPFAYKFLEWEEDIPGSSPQSLSHYDSVYFLFSLAIFYLFSALKMFL